MLRAENLIWISEPSEPYDEKYGMYHNYTTWQYKMKFDGVDCDTPFLMGVEEHEVYLAELEVIKAVKLLCQMPRVYRSLLDTVEKYGDAREEKGRSDVYGDWAEADAGASL